MEQKDTLRFTALIYTIIAFAAAMLATLLHIFSVLFFYEAEIGYFERGAVLPILAVIFSIASVIFFAVFAILRFRKKETAYEKATPPLVKLTSALCAALALVLGIYDLKAGSSVLGLLFCFGACLYFLLVLTSKTTPALSLLFGFCAILRLLTELAKSYVDFYLPMNSPEKLYLSTAIVAGIFFLVSEIRALVKKPYTATWFFSAASAVLVLYPSSLALCCGSNDTVFYHPTSKGALIFALLLLALANYALVRLFSVAIKPQPIEAPEVTELPPEEAAPTEEPEETEPIAESEEPKNTEETDNE